VSRFRVADYLGHILTAIERIEAFVTGMSSASFESDVRTQDAVIRNLEVIGEASRLIAEEDPEFVRSHPELFLRESYRMRNRLAHGYFDINLGLVWDTIQSDLPGMASAVRGVVEELSDAPDDEADETEARQRAENATSSDE
jgi:uncharacterized protein with HEPN domain